METFNIEVLAGKPKKIYGLLSYTGQITIGDFKEKFITPIDSWTLEQYKLQWHQAFERLKYHEDSCFVVTIQNISINPLIFIWTCYKYGKNIYFQNQMINETIAHEIKFPLKLSQFNIQTCYQFILPRLVNSQNQGVNEDGERISEWSLNLDDFLHSPFFVKNNEEI